MTTSKLQAYLLRILTGLCIAILVLVPFHALLTVWAADNFGQVLDDPFQPATPDNRENINYLTTGPDLTFALV